MTYEIPAQLVNMRHEQMARDGVLAVIHKTLRMVTRTLALVDLFLFVTTATSQDARCAALLVLAALPTLLLIAAGGLTRRCSA